MPVKLFACILTVFAFGGITSAKAALMPDPLSKPHELSRMEKKCIDDGYKFTYYNCTGQNAPSAPCPDHKDYYKNCSQEQWCRNNNYRLKAEDCKAPEFPVKACDNQFPLYRSCHEDIKKACETAGYSHHTVCQLTDKKCPYSTEYGLCCDNCPGFDYPADNIPEGYVIDGATCKTCEGIVKAKIKEAACDGFQNCPYGPESADTPSCLSGKQRLYTACRDSAAYCRDKGYEQPFCKETEDEETCPENENFKRCTVNCFKLAKATYPNANVITGNVTNPELDPTKTAIRSLVGFTSAPQCSQSTRPVITLDLNEESYTKYYHIFNQDISDVDFILNFEKPFNLSFEGNLHNSNILFAGTLPRCAFEGGNAHLSGSVKFLKAPMSCMNATLDADSVFITSDGLTGNLIVGAGSKVYIGGDMTGALRTGSHTQTIIAGRLNYTDEFNASLDSPSLLFGCYSKNKVGKGILADTSNLVLKREAELNTPFVDLRSTSNMLQLPNTLASVHLHSWAKLYYQDADATFDINYNEDGRKECPDKYYIHLGSSEEGTGQHQVIQPSNLVTDAWKCQTLPPENLSCD